MMKSKLVHGFIIIMLIAIVFNQLEENTVESYSKNTKQDTIIEQLVSSHFIFYSKNKDKICLKPLSNALESNYARITKDLHKSLTKKVNVYIYSDLDTYHKAINEPDAPNWVVGNAIPSSNTIQMVNPSDAKGYPYSEFMKVIVHEFTHIITYNISPDSIDIPMWLGEGIAVFEAKQDEGVQYTISQAKSSNKLPSLSDLESNTYDFGNNGGYQFSYSIVNYIVKNYGYNKLIDLIKSPLNFQKILGISKDDFQRKWVASLESKRTASIK